MQPIVTDTILQQRYRLIELIGEGSFGRTYLALDQSRFNEQCAIKELSLAAHSRSRLSKAKEFFKQEAALLYQLQHPQIPRFWATFEERDRLFLVQDYIPGNTYEDLLHERSQHQQTFTEAEVWRFLLQVLPVLGYIHSQGVVHQDISPDNIILREADLLPVLIDFGVVKQLASRLQGDQTEIAMVKVGKPGYAPVEQLRGGQAYPNSDLYSLAVTALVMLTGHAPTDLFNNEQINWAWRNWVNVSDGLANVLGKMLNYQPSERYQSAVEVFQALQSLSIPIDRVGQSQPTATAQLPDIMLPNIPGQKSRVRTVAQKVYTVLTQFDVKSMWEQPRVYIPLFFAMAFGSFAAGLVAMTLWQHQSETATTPSPSPTISSDSLVSPSSAGSSVKPPNTITLIAGETTVKSGQITADQQVDYEFYGTQGQDVALAIDNPKLLMTVLGANGLAVDTRAIRVPSWQGKIITTGKHIVQIKSFPGATGEPFDYRLSALLTFPVANPNPTTSSGLISPSSMPLEPPLGSPVQDLPITTPTGTIPLPVPIIIPSSSSGPRFRTTTPKQTVEQPTNNQPSIEPSVDNSGFPIEPSPESESPPPSTSAGNNDSNNSTSPPAAPETVAPFP